MERNSPIWHERLNTYRNAVTRLAEVIDISRQRKLTQIECDSLIKRFEFSFEMGWKLLMSYEKDNGVTDLHGSRDTIRQAYRLSLIDNGEAWLEMVDDRNNTSHLYDEEMTVDIADDIIHTYYPLFVELQKKMEELASR